MDASSQEPTKKEERTLKDRIMSLLSEDIDAKDVRWYPIGDGEDHDSWVRPGIDTPTHKEAFSYVADQLIELMGK